MRQSMRVCPGPHFYGSECSHPESWRNLLVLFPIPSTVIHLTMHVYQTHVYQTRWTIHLDRLSIRLLTASSSLHMSFHHQRHGLRTSSLSSPSYPQPTARAPYPHFSAFAASA